MEEENVSEYEDNVELDSEYESEDDLDLAHALEGQLATGGAPQQATQGTPQMKINCKYKRKIKKT